MLGINTKVVRDILVGFIKNEITKTGFKKGIVGLSGGLDSSTVLFLTKDALGNENVTGVIMPYKTSSKESIEDALEISKMLKTEVLRCDITPMIDKYFERFPNANRMRRGNKMARERMSILYDISAEKKGLVIGTSNKTELFLGYGTMYGDMACAINPLGDLYKTQVRELAKYIGVPEKIVRKKPTADLWMGQTDEEEIGYSYDEIDKLLYCIVDMRYSREDAIKVGFKPDFIDAVTEMIRRSQFKRRLPVIAKISQRTIDRDFRYARDWGM